MAKKFTFKTELERNVFRYLKEGWPSEILEYQAKAEQDEEDAADYLAEDLADLFRSEAPIGEDDDIYGDLLADAIRTIDFRCIARAFLEGVELPEQVAPVAV
jgi:hypothetical protein